MGGKSLSSYHRHAFVTGVSGGLGLAFAKMLLGEGIRVTGTARDTARLASLAKNPLFTPRALDLANPSEAEAAFHDAAKTAGEGGFDLVINNAGFGLFGAFAATDYATWQEQLDALLVSLERIDAFFKNL